MKNILLSGVLVLLAHWLSGQIVTNTPFQINSNNPIDTRLSIATLADTSTITFKWEGLLTHVNATDTYYKWNGSNWEVFDPGGGAVDSVNGNTGTVVLDADDIDDASTAHKFVDAALISKVAGIESGATADQSDPEIEAAYNNQVAIVSQAAAEAGTSTTAERWTPQRIAQAIAAQAALMTTSPNTNGGQTVYQRTGTATANEINDIISGVLVPVQDNAKVTDTVSVPAGFTFDPGIAIFRNGDGTFSTSIDDPKTFRDLYDVKGKTYYVDPVGGNNFGTGLTRDDPYQTYEFARTRGDVERIVLAPGIYPGLTAFTPASADSFALVCEGEAIIGAIAAQATWTATSMIGVYKTTVVDTLRIPIDLTRRGSIGEFPAMTKIIQDTAALEFRSRHYTFVGDSLYIHTGDGAAPFYNQNCFVVTSSVISIVPTEKFYGEGISFYGRISFSRDTSEHYLQRCNVFHSINADLITHRGHSIMKDCRFGNSATDGIDYDNAATAIEINCLGRYFGRDNSGSDNQASTAHGASQVITINCDYGMSSNQSIFDVNTGTQRWILGGRFGGHWNKETGSWGIIGAGNAVGDFSQIWIEGARIGGDNAYDLRANYGELRVKNIIGLSSATRINLSNGGTIQKY